MDYVLHTLVIANFWLPVVLAFNLLFGRGKVFHFGPVGTWVAISYAVVLTMMSTGNAFFAFLAGLGMALLVSAMFAWLSFRLEPDGLGVMAIAVHLTILVVILNWTSLTRGALGIPGVPRFSFMESTGMFAIVTSIISVLWIALFMWVNRSAFGRQIEALAENEWYANSMGISRFRVHFWAFILLGVSTLVAVFFFPQFLRILHPNDYHFSSFIFLVMIVVAGKPGSLWGGVLATYLLIALRELLRFVPVAPSFVGPMHLVLFGLILFVAVWIRRDSVFPQERSV